MTGQSRSRRPRSLNLSLSSRGSSRTCSPELESEDETSRSSSKGQSRNTSQENLSKQTSKDMRIFPAGPYCFKQPTLADVLSNTAPPPYTLSAFMAYLSQNHCLETLEFTMDANRYRKHYNSVTHPKEKSQINPKDRAYVCKLWQRLLDAYIVPNGPREVNIPCSIRDQILSVPNHTMPPPPEALDPAVNIVHELMQESVLVPFLSECQSTNAFIMDPVCPKPWHQQNASDESVLMQGSLDDRMLSRRCPDSSSPPSPVDFVSHSFPSAPPRIPRTNSPFSAALGWHHGRHNSHPQAPSSSWASSNASGDSMMVDDSGTSTPSWGTPMTPPTTPPASDILLHSAGSPKRNDKSEKTWKRMTGGLGRGLGWGKKKPEHTTYW